MQSVSIVIDWGFTRLKLWTLDEQARTVDQVSCFTKEISGNPICYSQQSLDSIGSVIARYLYSHNNADCVRIYLSSQMHCLAGVLQRGEYFLSTWNDLPVNGDVDPIVTAQYGVPLLHSMPINKLVACAAGYAVGSVYLEQLFSNEELLIRCVASPLTLVLSNIFQLPLPCSRGWWQSSCMASVLLDSASNGATYLSEQPIRVSRGYIAKGLELNGDILVYPEVGDLQAATSNAVRIYDVVINLGTGSQIVFSNLRAGRPWPYFRYWPNREKPLVTISHVPCGRLLSAYAEAKMMDITALARILLDLNAMELLTIAKKNMTSILFFPGYCSVQGEYLQKPLSTLEQIAELEPHVLLSLWVYQYVSLIQIATCATDDPSCLPSIGVTGSLGGMAEVFAALLEGMPSLASSVARDTSTLPASLISAFTCHDI